MNDFEPVALTIQSYDSAFEEFTENTRRVDTFPGLRDELDRFVAMLSGRRVIDIGFGSGRDLIHLSGSGLAVHGIELSLNFVYSLRKIASAPLCLMDMRHLGYASDVFDGIWCCATLLHLPRQEMLATLQEFKRVLNAKGILYVSVKEGKGDEWIEEGHIGLPRYFTYFSMDELCHYVEEAGFGISYTQSKSHQSGRRNWLSVYAKKTDY